MENMKLEGYEPVVYIKEEYTNISALNPIDLNIQDVEDEFGDKSEHKVYCSLTVVNPEEITCDSVGSDDYNSDWVFGLQSNASVVTPIANNNTTTTSTPNNAITTDGNQLPPLNVKNNELTPQLMVECEMSDDSTFSRLNDNSSSDNSNMYTYYSLPNDSSLVNFSHPESPHKKVDFKDWNNVVPEPKKVITKAEKPPPVKKSFPCPICNKVFASKSNLERHGIVHSDVKPFQCVECKRMFSRRVHLERHKFLHMDQKPFNCEICKKGFTQKTHLEKHQYIHTGVKPFECLQCNKSFARKESLNRHKAVHAANEKKAAAAAADNKDTSKINVIKNTAVKEGVTEIPNSVQSKNVPTENNDNKNNGVSNIDTLQSSVKVETETPGITDTADTVKEIKIENDIMETSEIVE